MSIVFAITDRGVIIADGLQAAQSIAANAGHTIVATVQRGAQSGAPIVEGISEADTLMSLTAAINSTSSVVVRDSIAAVLGTLAALWALPAGPYFSVIADQVTSRAFLISKMIQPHELWEVGTARPERRPEPSEPGLRADRICG